jgi:hypothetical protein
VNDELHKSRPGRQSLYVLVLLAVSFLAASNWSDLKALVGLE